MIPFPRYTQTALPTAVLTATFLIAGCSGSGPAAPPSSNPSITFGSQASTTPVGGPSVNIDDFAFAPTTLTIPAGSTVTWTNKDGEPHTVVANDGSFHSPAMDTNGTFSFTFPIAGSFDYVCSIHPFMHGTVVVTK